MKIYNNVETKFLILNERVLELQTAIKVVSGLPACPNDCKNGVIAELERQLLIAEKEFIDENSKV